MENKSYNSNYETPEHTLASSCLSAAAWNILPGRNGTAIEFTDIAAGHALPYTIEKANGKWSAYSKIGQTKDGHFMDKDNAGLYGAYYRIIDATGTVLDTISFDLQLFGDKILLFSPSDDMKAVATIVVSNF